MSKNKFKERNKYIKSTKEGRLYIPTADFFKQDKVIALVEKLMKSSIYKNITGKS